MTFLERILAPRPARLAGRTLYAAAVDQARRPEFYRDMGVADSMEGRFELYTLHVVLLLERLAAEPSAKPVSQALFDAYLQGLDDALRDSGVGDLSVGKKMRRLGEAAYGRLKSFKTAADAPDDSAMRELLTRTVYQDGETDPAPMLDYVGRARAGLAKRPVESLSEAAAWPSLS